MYIKIDDDTVNSLDPRRRWTWIPFTLNTRILTVIIQMFIGKDAVARLLATKVAHPVFFLPGSLIEGQNTLITTSRSISSSPLTQSTHLVSLSSTPISRPFIPISLNFTLLHPWVMPSPAQTTTTKSTGVRPVFLVGMVISRPSPSANILAFPRTQKSSASCPCPVPTIPPSRVRPPRSSLPTPTAPTVSPTGPWRHKNTTPSSKISRTMNYGVMGDQCGICRGPGYRSTWSVFGETMCSIICLWGMMMKSSWL